MRFNNAAIPVGMAWSSPFVKWQGSLSEVPTIDLAADVTGRALAARQIDPGQLDGLVLGWTTPQQDIFYGAPTLAARLGAAGLSGPMISQACATSVACLASAAAAVETGAGLQLVVAADRISNGPQILYPSPSAMGGSPVATNWVLESFARDPWAGTSMLAAGEMVAAEAGISRGELDELTALRSDQYSKALADDRAFQRRYMVEVQIPQRRKAPKVIDADEGVRERGQVRQRDGVDERGAGALAAHLHQVRALAVAVAGGPLGIDGDRPRAGLEGGDHRRERLRGVRDGGHALRRLQQGDDDALRCRLLAGHRLVDVVVLHALHRRAVGTGPGAARAGRGRSGKASAGRLSRAGRRGWRSRRAGRGRRSRACARCAPGGSSR